MQIQLNYKNAAVAAIGTFFIYLLYMLFVYNSDFKLPDGLAVDLRELVTYCVLAAECGGHAVVMVHDEKKLKTMIKGQTREGAAEFVTRADLISNQIIIDLLQKFPGLKLISEEKSSDTTTESVSRYRKDKFEVWRERRAALDLVPTRPLHLNDLTVWIDPLDATQEFTEDLTQYVSVMLCVAQRGRPIIGVVYRPFQRELAIGVSIEHYVYMSSWGNTSALDSSNNSDRPALVSRSHTGTSVRQLINDSFDGRVPVEAAGGAGYKSLRVLNGTAQFYVHTTVILKWDVCASDALIRAAGGHVLTLKGNEVSYFSNDSPVITDGLLVAIDTPYAYLNRLKLHIH